MLQATACGVGMGAQNYDGEENIQQGSEDCDNRIDKMMTATTTMMTGTVGYGKGDSGEMNTGMRQEYEDVA